VIYKLKNSFPTRFEKISSNLDSIKEWLNMQINNQCTTEAARYIVSRNEVIDSEPVEIAREPPPSHRLGRMDGCC